VNLPGGPNQLLDTGATLAGASPEGVGGGLALRGAREKVPNLEFIEMGGVWGKINRVCVGPAIWGVKGYPGSQTLPKTGAGVGIGTTFGSFRGAHTPKVFSPQP
jgi:hypothetical protein